MNHLNVRTKLMTSFGVILLIVVGCAVGGIISSDLIQQRLNQIYSRNLPALDYLLQADRDLQQLLVAERSMLSMDPQSEGFATLLTDYEENKEQSDTRFHKYADITVNEAEKALFPNYESARSTWDELSTQVITLAQAGDPESLAQATRLSQGDAAVAFEAMRDVLDQLTEINGQTAEQTEQTAKSVFKTTLIVLICLGAIGVTLGVVLALVITGAIVKPLTALSHAADTMAQGDFTCEVPELTSHDEIGKMSRSFIAMKDNTRKLIAMVSDASHNVASSSEELSAASEETSKGVQMIAQSINEISDGAQGSVRNMEATRENLEQSAQAISSVSRDIEEVASYASNAAKQGVQGRDVANQAVEIINSAAKSVQGTASVVQALGDKTNQIAEFISIITGIADQTNLLALNAAIEAARAGEAGRGFAVVAEEVRKLAEESNSAAGNITQLVKGIDDEMKVALEAMETSDREVAEGAESVSQAGDLLAEIVAGVQALNDKVQAISASAEQITASSSEAVHMVSDVGVAATKAAELSANVAAATEQQMASMEEIGANSSNLAKSAEELNDLVGRFTV